MTDQVETIDMSYLPHPHHHTNASYRSSSIPSSPTDDEFSMYDNDSVVSEFASSVQELPIILPTSAFSSPSRRRKHNMRSLSRATSSRTTLSPLSPAHHRDFQHSSTSPCPPSSTSSLPLSTSYSSRSDPNHSVRLKPLVLLGQLSPSQHLMHNDPSMSPYDESPTFGKHPASPSLAARMRKVTGVGEYNDPADSPTIGKLERRRQKNRRLWIIVICLIILLIVTAIAIVVGLIKGNARNSAFGIAGSDSSSSSSTPPHSSLIVTVPSTLSLSGATLILPSAPSAPLVVSSKSAVTSPLGSPLPSPFAPSSTLSPATTSIPPSPLPAPVIVTVTAPIAVAASPSSTQSPSTSFNPPPSASPTPPPKTSTPSSSSPALPASITICVLNGFNVFGAELGGTTTTLSESEQIPARAVCTVKNEITGFEFSLGFGQLD